MTPAEIAAGDTLPVYHNVCGKRTLRRKFFCHYCNAMAVKADDARAILQQKEQP